MDHFKGILVQVITNGEPLDLYDDPDAADVDDNRTRQYYVEAITGATFKVEVNLLTEFGLYSEQGTDAIRVSMNIDGLGRNWFCELRLKDIERRLLKGQPGGHTFYGPNEFDPRTKKWVRSDFTFGSLETRETATTKLSMEQIKAVGRIQISVQRRKLTRLNTPKAPCMLSRVQAIKELPEKALKGSAITNSISMTNARPSTPPDPIEYESVPIFGPMGRPIIFNILYRSKSTFPFGALQTLGCISRSPSPAIELSDDETQGQKSKAEGTPSEDADQEIQNLRARLAQLEGDVKVKPESAKAVKREREDDGGSGPRQRPRKSAKVETIDLTDD